jgi:hypothetical protein
MHPNAETRFAARRGSIRHHSAMRCSPHGHRIIEAIADYTRYLAQDLGLFAITVNRIVLGVIATRGIMATGHTRQRPEQP